MAAGEEGEEGADAVQEMLAPSPQCPRSGKALGARAGGQLPREKLRSPSEAVWLRGQGCRVTWRPSSGHRIFLGYWDPGHHSGFCPGT